MNDNYWIVRKGCSMNENFQFGVEYQENNIIWHLENTRNFLI